MTDCALLLRVSTDRQDAGNQVPDCERFMAARGLNCVRTFEISDSAWKNGAGGAEYQATIAAVKAAAHAGEFTALVVWALDRVVRTGPEEALRLNRELRERGCVLLSVKEDWLNTTSEIQDILLAFAGWMAERESARRSERVKAGLRARKAAGLPIGGKPGRKDAKPRRRSGYYQAWETDGARRRAHEGAR